MRQLMLQSLAGHPSTLPDGEVGVLDRQCWQWVGQPLRECAVQCAQFIDQDSTGPRVGDDVMRGQQQDMVALAQAQQASPQQRPALQIEWSLRLRIGVRVRSLQRVAFVAQIVLDQRKAAIGRGDHLLRLSIDRREAGP